MGQVSMEVALPVIAACGIRPSVLPTAMLSTHTGGFGDNTFLDLSDQIPKVLNHWQKINAEFDAVYLGYLGQNAISVWQNELDDFYEKDTAIILDPAMADHGRLYRGFDQGYVEKMKKLAQKATILTPNLTEAMLLLELPLENIDKVEEKEARVITQSLQVKFDLDGVVLTGVSLADNKLSTYGINHDDVLPWQINQEKLPGHYFGTGDLFASALVAGLLHDKSLKQSSKIAGEFVADAISKTEPNQDFRLGPNYAAALPKLMLQLSA